MVKISGTKEEIMEFINEYINMCPYSEGCPEEDETIGCEECILTYAKGFEFEIL